MISTGLNKADFWVDSREQGFRPIPLGKKFFYIDRFSETHVLQCDEPEDKLQTCMGCFFYEDGGYTAPNQCRAPSCLSCFGESRKTKARNSGVEEELLHLYKQDVVYIEL